MALPDGLIWLAVALTLGACSGSQDPDFGGQPTEAKQEIERTKEAADLGVAVEPPAAPSPPAENSAVDEPVAPAPVDPSLPVHFETATIGEPEAPSPSLYEAAQAEKYRRQQAQPSQVIITDANIRDYNEAGQLTEVTPRNEEAEADGAESEADAQARPDPETYWRTRVRDARLAWRAAADRIVELDQRVAQLRYDFYAQDDPYYRDSQIKPAWDRAAIELEQARLRTADLEVQVRLIIEEGGREGALPGWLREGFDFEPESVELDGRQRRDLESADAVEPTILEDPPR